MKEDYLIISESFFDEEVDDRYERISEILECETNISHYCSGKFIATKESDSECLLCRRHRETVNGII